MQHGFIPGHIEEFEYLHHPDLGVQHQLLVRHPQALLAPQQLALVVHGLDGRVPPFKALPVRRKVESCYGHLPGDDRVGRGATVAHHEDELRVREELYDVRAHFNGQRVLVAQPGGGVAVPGYDLEAERGDGRVQDWFGNASFF